MKTQFLIKQSIFAIVALLLPYFCYGQQEYFYSTQGKRVHMDIMEDRFVVKPATPITVRQVTEYLSPVFANARAETITGIEGFFDTLINVL